MSSLFLDAPAGLVLAGLHAFALECAIFCPRATRFPIASRRGLLPSTTRHLGKQLPILMYVMHESA
jgi:hypothetical protein